MPTEAVREVFMCSLASEEMERLLSLESPIFVGYRDLHSGRLGLLYLTSEGPFTFTKDGLLTAKVDVIFLLGSARRPGPHD